MTLTFRQRLGFRAEHRIADRMAPDLKRGLLQAIQDLRADVPFLRIFFERLDTERSVDALPWRDLELGLLDRFRAVFREAVERSMTAQVETIPVHKAAKNQWWFAGYADARDRNYLGRAPGKSMPEVPDENLPADWAQYLEGWRAGITGYASETLRTRHVEVPPPPKDISPGRVTFSLNLTNPRALQWIDRHAAELVVEVTEETKLAIRDQIRQMFAQGIPADEIARRLRPLIGLTRRDAAAVAKLRARLELENTKRLAEQRKPLPPERINDPVNAYAGRLLRARAERIARTESIRASAEGQQELWRQAKEQGFLDPARTRRAWLVTKWEKLCPICAALATDDALVGLEQPFLLTTGEVVMNPPAHPICHCATGLVFADEKGEFHHPQA